MFGTVYAVSSIFYFLATILDPNMELFGSVAAAALFPIFLATGFLMGSLYGHFCRAELMTYRAWRDKT